MPVFNSDHSFVSFTATIYDKTKASTDLWNFDFFTE